MIDPFSSASAMVAAVRAGEVSAADLVLTCRDRNRRLAGRVNAIVTPNHDTALEQARKVDAASGPVVGRALPLSVRPMP